MRNLEANYYLTLAAQRQKKTRPFIERCTEVNDLMSRHRSHDFLEGLAGLEQKARQLCGSPNTS